MLRVSLDSEHDRPLSLLCLGAHSDDVEIGCGGTVLRLLDEHPGTHVTWVVFSASDDREAEARASAAAFLAGAGSADVIVHRFKESYFPTAVAEIKDEFERLKSSIEPDLVLTHRRADRHQDHRTLAELTWNTFRDHLLLEYEIPKFEGDLGHPNLYVPLSTAAAGRKVELLMKHFGTQRNKQWFRAETFNGLMALRAIECNAADGWAEAFHVDKIIL